MVRLLSLKYYHNVVYIHNGILFIYEQELNYMYKKIGKTSKVILSEVSQAQTVKYCMLFSHVDHNFKFSYLFV